MRKILLSIYFCSCCCLAAQAAPSLGTQMPQRNQLFGGLQTYVLFNRTLDHGFGRMHSLQDFITLSYGVMDWLSIDLKGGFGNIRQRDGDMPDTNYHTFLAGGYGFRLKLYDQKATKVVWGFQHISVHPFSRKSIDGDKHKAVLDDWQFPLVVSHQFAHFTPYVGVRWAWVDQIHWTNGDRKLQKSSGTGLIVGTDIPLNERVWLNVEGQFFDSTAATASINFSF